MLSRAFILFVAAAPLLAQHTPVPGAPLSNTAMARMLWEEARTNVTRAATDVPESIYGYKPTPEVRSFGEIIAHVAESQEYYCRSALGQASPAESAAPKTKADIVKALTTSNADCARAYAQTDVETKLQTPGSDPVPRLMMLLRNATHDNEHYGNLVTYMRMNHLVPPSSQPAPKKP
jgi:uncharacterized damage-inducible protein DinB